MRGQLALLRTKQGIGRRGAGGDGGWQVGGGRGAVDGGEGHCVCL
jgi:hypothetical protein